MSSKDPKARRADPTAAEDKLSGGTAELRAAAQTRKGGRPKGVAQGRGVQAGYLDGQMLVAMPGMEDDRFRRTVVYVCAHSAEGAMGIVLNRPAADVSFSELLVQLDVIPEGEEIRLRVRTERMRVLIGGPVETSRGFVLHTPDFFLDQSTLAIDGEVCLTATVDILRAIARGDGPENAVLALGYAGWSPGQLESEIQANGWLNCPADTSLLFGAPLEHRYDLALRKIGIGPGMLSSQAGHA